ncbi:unnamed protein product [Effrenium voratum]|uniref:Uncharacterized protein n=1 Tax=Effrenium voratum TaxID=2562239 RepID=A0AA36N9N1_9DINO|nr:unnamed protein product [Effrenium voratum]
MCTSGSSLLHECKLCTKLSEALTPAVASIESSVAAALDAAREEVDMQLSGERLKELQKNVNGFGGPVNEFKSSMHGMFGPFVEQDLMPQVKGEMESKGRLGVTALALLAMLLTAFGLLSVFCWCRVGPGQQSASAHRCACCTWCFGCCYIWLAFIIGGILTAASVPMASFCLIMDDLDGEMLKDISRSLQLDLSGEEGDMAISLVEQCISVPGKNSSANPALLDIITMTETDGTKKTMRQKIIGDVTDRINQQFDAISAGMSGGDMSVAENANMKQLLQTLSDYRMDAMMTPEQSVVTNSQYKDMNAETDLQKYFVSSAACSDTTADGSTIWGLDSFSTSLNSYGAQQSHSTCAKKVACTGTAGTPARLACEAANNLMELKQSLNTVATYKCREFTNADGTRCDLLAMNQVSPGSYENDCFRPDGTLQAEDFDCTLEEFTLLVSSFSSQLQKAFVRLDNVTVLVLDTITKDMKALVGVHLLDKMALVASGVTCGFMAQQYSHFVDGFCFKGVWGFTAIAASYVACAVLTLFLVILTYMMWRFALDSYELQREAADDERLKDRE